MSERNSQVQALAEGVGVALRTTNPADPVTVDRLLEILRQALPDAFSDASGWWKGKAKQESAKAKVLLMEVLAMASTIENDRIRLVEERDARERAARLAEQTVALNHEAKMYELETERLALLASKMERDEAVQMLIRSLARLRQVSTSVAIGASGPGDSHADR